MYYRPKHADRLAVLLALLLAAPTALALESDREQPFDVRAEGTTGSFGDGTTILSGGVEIRQGTLHVRADEAEVEKQQGKVQVITFRGQPARMEQEIEEQGQVQAEARTITYQVVAGTVRLEGEADVVHPQYRIAGDSLTYNLDEQHFEGAGADSGDGRLRIRLEPEVARDLQASPESPPAEAGADAEAEGASREPGEDDDAGDRNDR